MDGESNGALSPHGHSPHGHSPHGQLVGGWWSPASTDVMSQLCRVCGEPAAGFHFGAFTCEGCKSFFGRTYNNLGSITECKNQGSCVINKKNRTSCKACRLRKCLLVGMSKSGSRYGRRSNWFKIHCLLQEQQHQHQQQQQQQQEQQRQQHAPPPVSPPDKSPKGSPSMPRGAATDALFGGAPLPSMLWGTPRGLLPPPPHGHPLQLPFPPFLPAAAAAAAAAFNGGVATPLFPLPPAHPPRPEWTRHSSPLSLARPGSTSPPPSPRIRAVLKTVVAPLGPPVPLRSPPLRSPPPRETGSPRLDVDDTLEQEQPMDLSRTAASSSGRQDTDEASDRDEGSDSGVSERESDRDKDGDKDGVANGSPASSPRPASPGGAAAPVDLTARHS